MLKQSFVLQLVGGGVLIGLWEALTRGLHVPEFIFPRFSTLVVEFCRFPGFFLSGMAVTTLESCAGLLFGGLAAYLLAVVFSFSKRSKQLFYHWFVALKTVPIIAISPMIVIWAGSGMVSKVVMASLITFFPILVNTLQGFYNITDNQRNLFESLNATFWQTFVRLRIPMSMSYFFAGLKIAAPLSAIGAIVAEFSGANKGLGYIILKSSWESNTRALMVAVLLASAMGIGLYKMIEFGEYAVAKFAPHVTRTPA